MTASSPSAGWIRVNRIFRVSLTSRQTTRTACGFEIEIDSSCYNSDLGRVVLSEARWVRGALAFEGDIGSYRQYLVNHEVGHAIGYHQHQPCETDGGLAPVMMQQTFGVENNVIATLDPMEWCRWTVSAAGSTPGRTHAAEPPDGWLPGPGPVVARHRPCATMGGEERPGRRCCTGSAPRRAPDAS